MGTNTIIGTDPQKIVAAAYIPPDETSKKLVAFRFSGIATRQKVFLTR
jgi:hypothetical protein